MALVTLLGLHIPSAIPYLVTEGILPAEPSKKEYDWVTSNAPKDDGDEEILATDRCVVWSRGGIPRRIFRFDVEGQAVVQATLACFPAAEEDAGTKLSESGSASEPSPSKKAKKPQAETGNRRSSGWSSRAQSYSSELYSRRYKGHGEDHRLAEGSSAHNGPRLSRALVVALRTQAHIYFLSGSSHVVHLPFEVDSILAAPQGIIIKRKFLLPRPLSTAPPSAPPNSFALSSGLLWNGSSLQHQVPAIGAASQERLLPHQKDLPGLLTDLPVVSEGDQPCLFCLADPLMELQPIVTTDAHKLESLSSVYKPRKSAFSALSSSEDLLYVSSPVEASSQKNSCLRGAPFALALTLNKQTNVYTAWEVSYTASGPLPSKSRTTGSRASGTLSKRRSSFGPGAGTGANTPILYSVHGGRESYGGGGKDQGPNLPLKLYNPAALGPDERHLIETDQLASSLDLDFEVGGLPAKESRRVSSLLARADLTSSQNKLLYPDLAGGNMGPVTGGYNTNYRRGESIGGRYNRNSSMGPLGKSYRASMSAAASTAGSDGGSFYDDAADERMGDSFDATFQGSAPQAGAAPSLRGAVLFRKIESFSAEGRMRGQSVGEPLLGQRIFTVTPPQDPGATHAGSITVYLCIVDKRKQSLLILTFLAEPRLTTKTSRVGKRSRKQETNSHSPGVAIKLINLSQESGIMDAIHLADKDKSRMLVLGADEGGYALLTLRSPWSASTRVALPQKYSSIDYRHFGLQFLIAKRNKPEHRKKHSINQKLMGLDHNSTNGMVDVVDHKGDRCRIQILMRPRDEQVAKVLEICRWILPEKHRGEGIVITWWEVLKWLRTRTETFIDEEWTALTITLTTMAVMFLGKGRRGRTVKEAKHASKQNRPSGGVGVGMKSWNEMLIQESSNGSPYSIWMNNSGWDWCLDLEKGESKRLQATEPKQGHHPPSMVSSAELRASVPLASTKKSSFLVDCVALSREFVLSGPGFLAVGQDGFLPTAEGRDSEIKRTALPTILIGLHLYREELKLNVACSDSGETGAGKLTPILAQLGAWLGWEAWSWKEPSYYSTEDASMQRWLFDEATITGLRCPSQPFEPPSIYGWVEKCLNCIEQQPFLKLVDIVDALPSSSESNQLTSQAGSGEYWKSLTPRTPKILELFARIAVKPISHTDVVQKMIELDFDNHLLDTLPEGLVLPLREAVTTCQADPSTTWDEKALRLVGRDDVRLLLAPSQERRDLAASQLAPTHEAIRDVHTICNAAFDTEAVGAFDGVAELDRQAITRLIFRNDLRFDAASKLVQSAKPSVARCIPEPDWSETDLLEAQKDLAQSVAIRTLSVPSGRGLMYFSARLPLLTERFPITVFNLSCIMKPSNNTVSADKSAYTEEKVGWAFFHTGVAAGLSISRDAKGIDTSWIMFNKPAELNNRHAGFLLALGLNGHLKSVAKWMAFKYLTPKHTMTSIGLLLGLSASYLGTMDPLLTRLLSVHVACMLPPGAAELNLSPLTQTTGLMATGLLYCDTQHRRMSEVMLSEIEHIDREDSSTPADVLRDEGYRLAAGFALGYINLGQGTDLKGLHDMHLVGRLLTLAVGTKRVDIVHVLDKSMAAATIAIALTFMKTHDGPLARKIDVPETLLQFDYVRPDIFLLRTLAKHLIMWNDIQPTYVWLKEQLPWEYREKMKLKGIHSLKSEDLPFFNILAGLCFSIGLRFAGTGATKVRDILRLYLDQFTRLCRLPVMNYDQKLTRGTVRNCQDLVALSAAIVMAGTGDLDIFRRLRSLHGRTDTDTLYGSHLAAHMAIGILFLGGGSHTFGTSNVAIASLICALYPLYPNSILDNKSHLQAFRHLCVLAAEPRCIVPREVDTFRPVSIPIQITLRDGSQRKHIAPCLLPELDNISSVSTASPEHWRVVLDFAQNPAHLASFNQNQSIYVRERAAHHSTSSVFHATFLALNDAERTSQHPFEWLLNLPSFADFDKPERALVLPSDAGNPVHANTDSTLVDARLLLEKAYLVGDRADRLRNLGLLFAYADRAEKEGWKLSWIKKEVVDGLRAAVYMALMDARESEG